MSVLRLASFALLGLITAGCGTSTLESTVRGLGFKSLEPPSTLLVPGTVIRVKKVDPLVAEIVCSQQQSLGPAVQLQSSATANDAKTTQVNNRSFNLGTSTVLALTNPAPQGAVKAITVAITNAKVFAITSADVFGHMSARDPACSAAVAAAQGDKDKLTLVTSVLQGDLAYTVSFDPTVALTLPMKSQVMKNLATALGVVGAGAPSESGSSADSSTVNTAGLYMGLQTDDSLVAPTPTAAATPTPAASSP